MNNGGPTRINGGAEEDDDDDDMNADLDAWERTYTDERSWEALQEDESGLLRPIDNTALYHSQYRRRLRSLSSTATAARIQKGLIRYLYVVIDLSRAASEMDFRPSRIAVIAKHVEAFIREFFDQNPLSQVGLVTIKDGVAQCLTDLGGSPESHIKALMNKLECSGDSSLQNALDLVDGYLNQIPSYGHREVLILYSALTTCDPGDIMETIQKCKKSKIRCSVIGLAAEMFICKHLCQETGGTYSVALDESHFKELILEHAPPPPAIAEFAIANLISMGFPQRVAEGSISICSCHKEAKVGAGYTCPRCKARLCELPTECRICGLTLVSSPHLARSYHHLFPIAPFDEVPPTLLNDPIHKLQRNCFGCQQSLINPGNKPSLSVVCPKCKRYFCLDCDIYIHESLHNCPGLFSTLNPKWVNLASNNFALNPFDKAQSFIQHPIVQPECQSVFFKHDQQISPSDALFSQKVRKAWTVTLGKQFNYSESEESIERYNLGLTERFCRGNKKGLSDLCLLDFSDLLSFMPSRREAAKKKM
ncbi:von Willebrand factor, type A [Corchorus olitorius]|uniref:General transcription factor IIH subunit 2 n=1 Tax=Corchorus olitorius TaxID=93759 RepID=A0A1R3KRM7_9ROSI|nr:von Willebrand factor, type A [Corchorus olitorius]